jgi:hypothetical protein
VTHGISDMSGFLRLADILIPEGLESPSAAKALEQEDLVGRALAARSDLLPLVNAAIAMAGGAQTVAELGAALGFSSAEFRALTLIVSGAYYLAPGVLETLDYDPPAERYVNGSLEQEIRDMLAHVQCTPRWVP